MYKRKDNRGIALLFWAQIKINTLIMRLNPKQSDGSITNFRSSSYQNFPLASYNAYWVYFYRRTAFPTLSHRRLRPTQLVVGRSKEAGRLGILCKRERVHWGWPNPKPAVSLFHRQFRCSLTLYGTGAGSPSEARTGTRISSLCHYLPYPRLLR